MKRKKTSASPSLAIYSVTVIFAQRATSNEVALL